MITKLILAIILAIAGYALLASEEECQEMVYASDVPLWIARQDGHVNYIKGNWYDGNGVLIGTSANEDSDICSR